MWGFDGKGLGEDTCVVTADPQDTATQGFASDLALLFGLFHIY